MPRNIVLLSDGTGNSAGKLARTNVWRLYQALDLRDPEKQVAFYDDGVGTSSFKPLRLVGGVFGYGLKNNVLDLYRFLCRNYREGDRIYCFGFSRGAFTAGVVTGLITYEGVVRYRGDSTDAESHLGQSAKWAFREYRAERYRAKFRLDRAGRAIRNLAMRRGYTRYREERKLNHKPPVHFLGLWDAVSAYGLPIDEMSRALNWIWPLQPENNQRPPNVNRIYHAVAVDDERDTFHPRLFDESAEPANAQSTHLDQETLSQVWFSGMHSNVGGGYPDDSLSMIPFDWMTRAAERDGLLLRDGAIENAGVNRSAAGRIYDSRRGVSGFYRYRPRRIDTLARQTAFDGSVVRTFDWKRWRKNKVTIPAPKIHESVLQRIASDPEYAPLVIPAGYRIVTQEGDVKSLGDAGTPETHEQARNRISRFEAAWNLVWLKRVFYFLSVALALRLALMPYWKPIYTSWDFRLAGVGDFLAGLGRILPDFLGGWIEAFQSHPSWFLALLAGFGICLKLGDSLQKRIHDESRAAWKGAPEKRGLLRRAFDGPVARLRESGAYVAAWRLLKEIVLPALILIATLSFVSRSGFLAYDSLAPICGTAVSGQAGFLTNSPCWTSGQRVTAGQSYVLQLTIPDSGPWRDWFVSANPNGFRGAARWFLAPFAPARRHWEHNWFRMIVQVGEDGHEIHTPRFSDEGGGRYAAEFVPHSSGTLFLYVNDAVVPGPAWMQWFYRNNRGAATVELTD